MLDELKEVVALTRRDLNALAVFEKTTKMGEEFGEFCEAVLAHYGVVRMKDRTGTPMEEGIDIILMVMDVLSSCYVELSPDDLLKKMEEMLVAKKKKWRAMMDTEDENGNRT